MHVNIIIFIILLNIKKKGYDIINVTILILAEITEKKHHKIQTVIKSDRKCEENRQNSHTLLAQSGRSESNCVFVDFAFVEVILGLYVLLEEVGGILE